MYATKEDFSMMEAFQNEKLEFMDKDVEKLNETVEALNSNI